MMSTRIICVDYISYRVGIYLRKPQKCVIYDKAHKATYVMKKIILIILALVLLALGIFLFLRFRGGGGQKGQAVLKVTSNPTATIFLDNEKVGTTPYEDKVEVGEFTIKLIPESTTTSVVSWEEKIKLEPNLLTFVNRELGESDLKSGGEVLTLEKISGKEAQLAVLSVPDGATIMLSGEEKGATPTVLQDVAAGSYELQVAASGFLSRSVKIKTTEGYKLNASFQLMVSEEPAASPTTDPSGSPASSNKPTASTSPRVTPRPTGTAASSASPKATQTSPPPKPYVEILETPTGFLRVRKDPSTSAEELARVNPGEYFPLLDEESSWYKIEYENDKEGWISNQYAKKFE